ncbi:hypothetical protein GCM10010423_00820 [Streptomyces levis]|uniref:Uncharacterized protein n=1 Tax=Streptomyces levis TaxID=285566 RepID=A0ABP6ABG7_9ACTN
MSAAMEGALWGPRARRPLPPIYEPPAAEPTPHPPLRDRLLRSGHRAGRLDCPGANRISSRHTTSTGSNRAASWAGTRVAGGTGRVRLLQACRSQAGSLRDSSPL